MRFDFNLENPIRSSPRAKWRPRAADEAANPFPDQDKPQERATAQDADDIESMHALVPDEIDEIIERRKKRAANYVHPSGNLHIW